MKDSTKRNQVRKTYLAFKEEPRTRLQVAELTGIMRANICRYVATFRNNNQVAVVKKGSDPISKHPAEFLTTDPDLFPEDNQNDLFGRN